MRQEWFTYSWCGHGTIFARGVGKSSSIRDVGKAHLQLLVPSYAVIRSTALRAGENIRIDEVERDGL